jgi:hypothetical protein
MPRSRTRVFHSLSAGRELELDNVGSALSENRVAFMLCTKSAAGDEIPWPSIVPNRLPRADVPTASDPKREPRLLKPVSCLQFAPIKFRSVGSDLQAANGPWQS